MTKVIAGLNMDLGLRIEGILPHSDVRDLTDFVFANLLSTSDRKKFHKVPVYGDLFGFKAPLPDSLDEGLRLKLNTAPVVGHVIINNLYKEASLTLFANLNGVQPIGSGEFAIEAMGLIKLSKASVFKKYESAISSIDLDDVLITTELQPNKQIELTVGLGLPVPT